MNPRVFVQTMIGLASAATVSDAGTPSPIPLQYPLPIVATPGKRASTSRVHDRDGAL